MDIEELQSIISYQRRRITAMYAADLDLAFKLQLEEAINASSLHLPNDGAAQTSLAELIERSDRDQVDAEMSRIRDDLDRQLHDQVLSRDLLGVPEEEWIKIGDDHFHGPYNGLKKTLASISVLFRRFGDDPILALRNPLTEVKSLIECQSVAISLGLKRVANYCHHNTLFQYLNGQWLPRQGNIAALVDQAKLLQRKFTSYNSSHVAQSDINFAYKLARDGIFSHIRLVESSGGKSLMETCVICLEDTEITRMFWVDCCLHHYCFSCMKQHVEVKLLQGMLPKCPHEGCTSLLKIECCKMFLTPELYNIMSLVESSSGKNLMETCVICLEDTEITRMFRIDCCLHQYCFSCMKQHVEVKLLQGMLPKCPHQGCKSLLKIERCQMFLTPELYDIMSLRIKEASIPATDKVYCPNPRCSALMSKNEILVTAINKLADAEAGARKCTKCGGLFCVNCKVAWHSKMTCYKYKKKNPYPCKEDAKLKSIAKKKSWRQCVKCSQMVELAEGCYHIYCRCGYEFCYTCGAEWKNKKATCTCPIWDERNIIRH